MSTAPSPTDWNKWAAMIRELPPQPRCLMAHDDVPRGQVFRQWNTRGDLIVWVNRGEVAELPHRDARPHAIAPNGIDTEMLRSIPVVNVQ